MAEKEGVSIPGGDIHHWNFNKADYPSQVFDPRNLFPTNSRIQHDTVHFFTASGEGFDYASPTLPGSVLEFNSSHYPLPENYLTPKVDK